MSQNPKSNATFLIEVNTLLAELKKNKIYVVVPTTYKPGMDGKYVLTISLSHDFFISELKEPVYNKIQKSNGRFEPIPKSISINSTE